MGSLLEAHSAGAMAARGRHLPNTVVHCEAGAPQLPPDSLLWLEQALALWARAAPRIRPCCMPK